MTLDPTTLATLYAPTSPGVGAIAAALSKAQGAMQNAAKTSTNPQTRSSYADLTTVLDVARGPLSEHGLSVVQAPYQFPGSVDASTGQVTPPATVLVSTIFHESGEWIRSVMPVNARKQRANSEGGGFEERDDMASIGAAISYARRYALVSMLGVGQEDDEPQVGRPNGTRQAPQRPQQAAPAARQPAAEPAPPDGGGITTAQLKALAVGVKKQGLTGDQSRAFFGWLFKREISSAKELTKAEASRVIGWEEPAWTEALADYAASLDEPDWSNLGEYAA